MEDFIEEKIDFEVNFLQTILQSNFDPTNRNYFAILFLF